MTSLFNFNKIQTNLCSDTRSLRIKLDEYFSIEMLFEFESILNWATNKPEIATILIEGKNDQFPATFAPGVLEAMEPKNLIKFTNKLRKIIYSMFYLPHTIVMNINNKAELFGAELTIAADIRVGSYGVKMQWNHLENGLPFCCGGSGILPTVTGQSLTRQWILSGKTIHAQDLKQTGYITETFQVVSEVNSLLKRIAKQSPVSRIQTKRALLEPIIQELDKALKIETEISSGALATKDYQVESNSAKDFISTKDFSQHLQDSRI